MARLYTPLFYVLPILMADAIVEVGLIGNMVGFLHDRAGKSFTVAYPVGSTFELHGKPVGLLADQGHTSNGAAGTAFVLIGIGGFLAVWFERRRTRLTGSSRPSGIFTTYLVFTILSFLLTLAALIYTFILTYRYDNQSISLPLALQNPEPILFPEDKWTPENWFVAVLALPLAKDSDRRKINQELDLMRAWRWNLIPLVILGGVVMGVTAWQWMKGRKLERRSGHRAVQKEENF